MAITEIDSDAEIEQSGQQDEDVARAIQEARAVAHPDQMIVIAVHVLSRQQKDDENKEAED